MRRYSIKLSEQTIDILETEAHRRDCSIDTLLCELVEVSKVERLPQRDPRRARPPEHDDIRVNGNPNATIGERE